MGKHDWQGLLNGLENDMRAGRSKDVVARLVAINCAKPPRESRPRLAQVARRDGQLSKALKFLAPYIELDRQGSISYSIVGERKAAA